MNIQFIKRNYVSKLNGGRALIPMKEDEIYTHVLWLSATEWKQYDKPKIDNVIDVRNLNDENKCKNLENGNKQKYLWNYLQNWKYYNNKWRTCLNKWQ